MAEVCEVLTYLKGLISGCVFLWLVMGLSLVLGNGIGTGSMLTAVFTSDIIQSLQSLTWGLGAYVLVLILLLVWFWDLKVRFGAKPVSTGDTETNP